jgi:hypothetical protein
MPERNDDFWGEPIFKYCRAQAIADGLLVDLTTATNDNGAEKAHPSFVKVIEQLSPSSAALSWL